MIKVLIVDDHSVVREGLRAFLELQDGIEVAGEAADGAEAIEQARRLHPDVVLMDLVMPRVDGVEAMRGLRGLSPETRVIVLTSFLEDERLLPAIQAGAAGYLLKNVAPAELARAIRAAHVGEAIIDPPWPRRLVRAISEGASVKVTEPGASDPARARGAGADRREAARTSGSRLELGIAEKTVKTHVGHLLAKLDVADRTQAALLAIRDGLVQRRAEEGPQT